MGDTNDEFLPKYSITSVFVPNIRLKSEFLSSFWDGYWVPGNVSI